MRDESSIKILICNGAYLGDLILSTAALPVLKLAFPHSKIGFLIGSWSLPVVQNHSLIDWVHLFDHPALNRLAITRKKKQRRGGETWLKSLEEIKAVEYDVAIDLYSAYKSKAGSLIHQANIPRRVGYWAHDNPLFYNDLVHWNREDVHMIDRHGEMLKQIGIKDDHLNLLNPVLSYKEPKIKFPIPDSFRNQGYVLIHMGVGEKKREWNTPSWIELTKKLEQDGFNIVFLGRGESERKQIELVSSSLSNHVNLCNLVEWKQLLPLIEDARLVIGLESMMGHLAAALNTPGVFIYGGTYSLGRWRPRNPRCHVITPPQEAFDKSGLAPCSAIHLITAEQVYNKVIELGPPNDLGNTFKSILSQ